jgi:uncharacterized membrane protein YphA (DoxX/SURF4 family)
MMKTMHWTLSPAVRWVALLLLCAAYLQGGLNKAMDFDAAIGEMNHFGLSPAGPLAVAVIVLELGAAALILAGFWRWLGALALGGFTLMATFVALRFWELPWGRSASWRPTPSSNTWAWSAAFCSSPGST